MAYTPVWPAWKDSMACRSNDHGLSLLNGIVDSFRITESERQFRLRLCSTLSAAYRPPPLIQQPDGAVGLVQIALNLQEIVIREFSPVLLKMSLELTPTLFELLRVHDALLEKQ